MKMSLKPSVWAVAALFLAALISANTAQAEEQTVGQLFIQAFDNKDEKMMKQLIKTRAAEVPGEVKDMVEYAMSPEAAPQARDFIFNIAGMMSKIYADQTGDERLLNAVRGNYEKVLQGAAVDSLDPEAVTHAKKEIAEIGAGQWRVITLELEDGALLVEIDVRESGVEGELTPKIDFKKSQETKDLLKKKFPAVKSGKISWNSMGVGLKTLFLE